MTDISNQRPNEQPTVTSPEQPTEVRQDPTVAGVPPGRGGAGDYFGSWISRIKSGDTGVLPVVVALIVIAGAFQSINSQFLTAGNLVHLIQQGAPYMCLAMAAIFVLLLGEVDLSLGFLAGVSATVLGVELVNGWSTWAALALALAVGTLLGVAQGLVVAFLRVPSFVVTLAGYLAFNGFILLILGNGGSQRIRSSFVNSWEGGQMSPTASWILWAVFSAVLVGYRVFTYRRAVSRGLAVEPVAITALKVGLAVVAGLAIVLLSNVNRSFGPSPIRGVPWAVLIVLGIYLFWSFVLSRTRFGRYVYAVGANPEAARRAGIKVPVIRTVVFTLAALTASLAGWLFASRAASIQTNFNGGQYILYAIAAAVIGGTSLFGGRGKMLHGILGGLVIAGIDNGMGLITGISDWVRYVVTAGVLLAAVIIDATARRGRAARGMT